MRHTKHKWVNLPQQIYDIIQTFWKQTPELEKTL